MVQVGRLRHVSNNKIMLITDEFCAIDWKYICDLNSTLSKDCHVVQSKFAFRWTSTGTRKQLIKREQIICPSSEVIKDHVHILACRAPTTILIRKSLLD